MRLIKDLNEIKELELNILKYIHRICEENNLVYYMAGGTLLGAVRHGGFIPWDDDIDLLMYREDYEKLVDIINNDNSYYRMECLKSDNKYIGTFAKVIDTRTKVVFNNFMSDGETGVFVDIFPMDGVSNNYKGGAKYLDNLSKWYQRFVNCKVSMSENGLTRLILNKGAVIFEKIAKKRSCSSYRYIARVVNIRGKKELMKKSWFDRRKLIDFETEKFYAPIGYHYYLKGLYGDYMKLPPHAEQRLVHSYNAYWKK